MKDSKPTEFNQVSLPNVINLIVTVIVLFVTAVNMDKNVKNAFKNRFVRLNITGPFWLSVLDKVGHFRPLLISLIE